MKHIDVEKLLIEPLIMNRAERLSRWAELVRKYPDQLKLYRGLEYMQSDVLRGTTVEQSTAFAVAMADPVLNAAGLPQRGTVGHIMDFFQLHHTELHQFCCGCGGVIENEDAGDMIEYLSFNNHY